MVLTGAVALKNGYISSDTPVVFKDYDCAGDEASLDECPTGSESGSGPIIGNDCYYHTLAGLICQGEL